MPQGCHLELEGKLASWSQRFAMASDKWPGERKEGTELYSGMGKWRSVERWVDVRLELYQCGFQEICILDMLVNTVACLITFMTDDTYGLKGWRKVKKGWHLQRKFRSTQLYMFGPKSSFPEESIWTSPDAKWDGQGIDLLVVSMSCE